MTSLITLLTIAPVLVHSLKCYEGFGGEVLKLVEKGDDKKQEFMCQFEPINPCHFNEPDQYSIHEFDKIYASKCWVLDRAVCFCAVDKCNGNYTLLMERWTVTKNKNQTMHDCVKAHIQKLIDHQPVYKEGSKAYQVVDISDEEPTEEPTHSGAGPEGSGTPGGGHGATLSSEPSGATKAGTPGGGHGATLSSEPSGATKAGDGQAGSDATNAGDHSASTNGGGGGSTSAGEDGAHSSTDPNAPANAAQSSGSNPAGAKGKSKKDGYNWLLFTILAVIAGILIFIVIPILLIMIVAKYSKTKSASKGKAGKQGHGKSKRGTSKSKGPRSKSSKGTKSQSKSMQSKSI